MLNTRNAIITEAKRWLGARWHHEARLPYQACDCGQLLIDVYVKVGLVEDISIKNYPRQWALHRDEERYLAAVERYARQAVVPLPGDIVVFKVGRTFSHGGIIVAWPMIIHADISEGVVLADASVGKLGAREYRFYTVL